MTTQIKRVAIYARASTDPEFQNPEHQLIKLREYCKFREWEFEEFSEFVHGDSDDKPVLKQLLKKIEAHHFQALVVWQTDRAARDSYQTHLLLKKLQDNHAYFVSAGEGMDTTTEMGEAIIKVAGIFAEMQLKNIRRNVRSGMARAKAQGTRSGKPIGRPQRVLPTADIQTIREAEPGISISELAKRLDVPRTTLKRFLDNGKTTPQ